MIAPPAHQQQEPPVLFTFPSPFQAHSSPPTSVPARRAQASSFIKMKSIKVSGKQEHKKSLWGNKSRLPSVVSKEFIPDRALENGECRQDSATRGHGSEPWTSQLGAMLCGRALAISGRAGPRTENGISAGSNLPSQGQ